jgi:hypothetical protein
MQTLATYVEKKGFAQRTYSLHDEKIEIKAKRTPRGDFEIEIALKDLRLPADIIYRTGELAQATAILPGLVLLIGIFIFGEKLFSYSKIIFWTALAAAVAGMIFGSLKARRFKFYSYNNESGMPAFDISEHGNKRTDLESFGDLIGQQIKKSKQR